MRLSADQTPITPDTVALPDVNEADLRTLHMQGMHRFGVMAAFLNPAGQLLMLEHDKTPKTEAGMWGPLGETSHVRADRHGHWHVEPLLLTILRGLREEVAVELEREDIWLPTDKPSIFTSWPLGMINGRHMPDNKTAAQTPFIYVSQEVAEMLVDGRPSAEVRRAAWMDLGAITELSLVRPGVIPWARKVAVAHAVSVGDYLANPEPAGWSAGLQPAVQDAILHDMFTTKAAA